MAEGQYEAVVAAEVRALRNACKDIDAQLVFSFVSGCGRLTDQVAWVQCCPFVLEQI